MMEDLASQCCILILEKPNYELNESFIGPRRCQNSYPFDEYLPANRKMDNKIDTEYLVMD